MENFNFITDRTPLTPEEIQANKNFDKVLQQYKSAPVKFYKKGWFKAGLATVTVAATGTILFFATGTNNKNEEPGKKTVAVTSASPYADESPCVKSPVPQIDISEKQFVINPQRDTILYYETGSAIQVPAGSVVGEDGNSVNGQVVIKYREFHNPLEVFASGIPMQYDSAGKEWHLQSAGMIEITAWKGDTKLAVKPEKPLTVQMKSGVPDGAFNVYYLDTAKRNWNFKGQDQLLASNNQTSNTKHKPTLSAVEGKPVVHKIDTVKIKNDLKALLPAKPRHVNPKCFSFSLDVLESEFPELAIYGKTKFEVEDKNNVFNNQIYSTEWEDASLKTIVAGEKYEMTLTRGVITRTFNVIPVMEGKEYTAALDIYRKKYKEYEQKLEGRLKEEKRKVAEEKVALSKWEQEQADKHRLRIQDFTASNKPNDEVLARFSADNSNTALVTRAFAVNKFGIWNCDKPADFPHGEKVMARFYDESGDQLPLTTAFLCERENKSVYTYKSEDFAKFRFNPGQKNIIWGSTPDGKLYYGLEEVFASENKKDKQMIFQLKRVDGKLTTLKQVKQLFRI